MKHPILGQSFENAIASLADITQGEHIVDLVNCYLTIFLIGGFVGLAAFIFPSVMSFKKLIARARRDELLKARRSNRAFLLSTMTATYIYIYSTSFIERMALYPLLLLACARLTSAQLVRGKAAVPLAPPVLITREDEARFPERLVPA